MGQCSPRMWGLTGTKVKGPRGEGMLPTHVGMNVLGLEAALFVCPVYNQFYASHSSPALRLGLRPRRSPILGNPGRPPRLRAAESGLGRAAFAGIRALRGDHPPDRFPETGQELAALARAHPFQKPQTGLRLSRPVAA